MGHLADIFSYNAHGQIAGPNVGFFMDEVDNNEYRLNILGVIRDYLARGGIDELTRDAALEALEVLHHRAKTETFITRKRIIKVMSDAGCYPLWAAGRWHPVNRGSERSSHWERLDQGYQRLGRAVSTHDYGL